MAKKQFIRHLEFYGFPDQNVFSNDWDTVDLSEIIKKNQEQDEEIGELNEEKASKQELETLSGTVTTLISAQTEFNNEVIEGLNHLNDDIVTLKEVDVEFGNQLSAITDGVNDVIGRTNNIEYQITRIDGDLNNLGEKVETLSGETFSGINEAQQNLVNYGIYADATFAKKDDVYTKEEIDDGLGRYATREWVGEQGFYTELSGDSRYTKIDTFNELSAQVEQINGEVLEVSGKTNALEASIEETNEKIDILSGETDTKLAQLKDEIEEAKTNYYTKGEIDAQNAEVAESLNELEEQKADKSEVAEISVALDTKMSQTDFEAYRESVSNRFDELDYEKADKESLNITNANVEALDGKIEDEKANRIANDNSLSGAIDANEEKIEIIREENVERDEIISTLQNNLAQEVLDRQEGDAIIIGASTDVKDDNTIYGAKKYADNEGIKAVNASNEYTDNVANDINNSVVSLRNWTEQNFSSAATKAYVDAKVNEAKDDLTTKINTDVQAETSRAQGEEIRLNTSIAEVRGLVNETKNSIPPIANKVNAITSWDGTDPYVSGGTGVLDILHDEFHALVRELIDKGIIDG